MTAAVQTKSPRISALLQSGIIFTIITFATSLGNFAMQALLGNSLPANGDYADANSAIGALIPLLSLLPATASIAITHYIAHFSGTGDAGRLQGLLLGCRRFLFIITIAGSVLTLIVIKPLGEFFHFHETMTLAVLVNTLFTLWSSFAFALCSGLGWFKRLALIGFLTMVLKIVLVWLFTKIWASAEMVVLATALALLANFILLFWRKELALHGKPISPWNAEFAHFFIVSAAFTLGNICFFQGDLFVMQHIFTDDERGPFTAAGVLARALPTTVQPLMFVLFTSRTVQQAGSVVYEQLKLLGLSGLGLICGAGGLVVFSSLALKITGRISPEATAFISPFAVTMVFVGLLQSLAFWVLASRWLKTSLLYGALGVGYWLALLGFGKTPGALLHVMPIAAGIAFAVLFAVWLYNMRRQHSNKPD